MCFVNMLQVSWPPGGECESAQAGWPQARCEATPAVSASPCQCTPPSAIDLLTDIPKQLYSLMMQLVVLSSRWAGCVVA
jgi:hypothetical protein